MITLESLSARLVATGAVFEVWNSPLQQDLVGELRWIDANRVFWFVAHGDREDDGHVLEFDLAEPVPSGEIHFYRGGRRIGRLSEIAAAEVEDREDYRVAFSLWQQVAPRAGKLIERSRERLVGTGRGAEHPA